MGTMTLVYLMTMFICHSTFTGSEAYSSPSIVLSSKDRYGNRHMIDDYREAYNLFACNGILFNHESPRRGETFVTRKITRGLSNISLGLENCLYMGNIDSLRDWGHAKDYVRMQWMMLQIEEPQDNLLFPHFYNFQS